MTANPDLLNRAELERSLLRECVGALSVRARRRILAAYRKRLEGAQGFAAEPRAFWEPVHREALEHAREALGL